MMAESKPFWPDRRWWAMLLVILIVAGALRYTGYNFSLPYVDHVDEPAYNIAARMIIDFGSPKPIGMHGYPPGIIAVNYVLLRFFHDPTTPPSSIIWMVRLISVTFSLATIASIALLGFRIATPAAGLLAAVGWTFLTLAVEYSRYATADNFVSFFTITAFFLTLTGIQFDRNDWILGGLIATLLAIVFKYQAIFVLPLLLLAPLWRLTQPSVVNKRLVWRNVWHAAIICSLFFFWLIVLFPSLEATYSPDWSAPTERLGIPTPAVVWHNLSLVYTAVANDWLWLPGLAGLLVLLWRPWRDKVSVFGILVTLLGMLAWITGMSFYGAMGPQTIRQYISAAILLHVLQAVGLVGWAFVIMEGLRRVRALPVLGTYAFPASIVLVAALFLAVNLPDLRSSIANAHEHTLPDRRNDLAVWMDESLPPGAYISGSENHKTFNNAWGGYRGLHDYPLYEVASLLDRPIDEWRAAGVRYAIISPLELRELQDAPDIVEQILVVKEYPESAAYRGPSMAVVRLAPIQHPATGTLGTISLIGYDLDSTIRHPGEILRFNLYWQATAPTDSDYVVYNHLVALDSREVLAQVDGPPLFDERRGTSRWDDPKEVLVSREYTLTLPDDLPPGEYRLITGFYRRDTGQRLLAADGDDYLLVTPITIR